MHPHELRKEPRSTRDNLRQRFGVSALLAGAGIISIMLNVDSGPSWLLGSRALFTGTAYLFMTKCLNCRQWLAMLALTEAIESLKAEPAVRKCPHCRVSVDRQFRQP